MANAKAVIDIDINASPAAAELRRLQSQINGFSSALNKANVEQGLAAKGMARQLSDLVNSSKFFTAETVRMRTSAAQLDDTLRKGQVTMGQFFSARFRKDGLAAAQVMSLANARASALETQFIQVGAAAGGMRDALAIRPLQAFNSAAAVSAQQLAIHRAMLQQATTSMINFGKNTQWAGRQLMVGFTVPLTIFAGVAGKTFRDLDKEATNFRKVYGDIFTTDVDTENALKEVRALSLEFTKYGIEAKKTMELAAIAAQAGQQGAKLMAATTQATRLAVLGDMENQEAMKTTIALQSAFKMSNEELAESINFLNMVENQSVLSLQDVAGAIPRVAPVIQGLGGDVKDLSVLLVAMKEGGVSAGEGANALKSSMGRLITPTKQASEMARSFGINLEDIVSKNAGDVLQTVVELATAMKSLSDIDQQKLLSTIFGKFQYARIGALFENITRDGSQAQRVIELMGMSTADMAASAEKELSAIEQSVSIKFIAAMERLKAAIAPIGELFTKMAVPIINFLSKIAEKFNELPDFAKNFLGLATVVTGLVIPAGTMFLGLLMNLIGTLVKFGHLVGIAFKGFLSGGIKVAFENVSQALRYMSLKEIDASLAAQQLAGSTEAVNAALLDQVSAAAPATTAIMGLAGAYEILVQNMRESMLIGGLPMAAPGQASLRAGSSKLLYKPLPIVARNKGGSIPYMSSGNTVPGTGNTDTVPAMLTPGEFVVNKQATQQNLGLLHAINDGDIQYRNKGGGIARSGQKYYGPRPNPYSLAAQQAQARLEQFESSRSAIASLFGLPSGGPAARASKQLAATQSSSSRNSKNIYEFLMSRKTKGAKLVRKAVELGLSPSELGLKRVGNLVLGMSPSANMRMANGSLTRASLIDELSHSSVYSPLDKQLVKYFGRTLDKASFDEILRSQIDLLPESGITNALFEKATRNALRIYLDQNNFNRSQRNSFLRDVLAPNTVRANVPVGKIRRLLDRKGIQYNEDTGDIIALIDGEEYNFSNLAGRTIDKPAPPSGIIRWDKIGVGKGLAAVHANKGGMIPGIQYLFGGGVAATKSKLIEKLFSSSLISRSRDLNNVGSYGTNYWLTRGATTRSTIDEYIAGLNIDQRRLAAKTISDFSSKLTRKQARTAKTIEHKHLIDGDLDEILSIAGLPKISETMVKKTHATHLTKALVRNGRRYVSRYTANYDALSNLQANQGTLKVSDFIERNLTSSRKGKYDEIITKSFPKGIDKKSISLLEKEIDKSIKSELEQYMDMNISDDPMDGTITFEDVIKPIIDQAIISAGGSKSALRRLSVRNILRMNKGGMIPGIPGYMAGAKINPLFKEIERRRARVAVAKGKTIDDIIFARGSDKKLNASAFDLLTLLRHNPNLTKKELERIQKYHGKRIRDGVFGRFDPQFGIRFKDSDSPTWRDVANLLDEKGFPVIQKRNKGGIIPGFVRGGGPIGLLRSYMAGNFDIMRDAATRRSVLSLAAPTTGTFYRGTQIGSGALPKGIERALLEAEKTGDYSKVIGRTFRMRSSDWSTDEKTATRFISMNSVKQKKDFLEYQRNLVARQIKEAEEYLGIISTGRVYVNRRKVESTTKSLPMLKKDLERITKELEEIGDISPVLIKASGTIKGVEASKLVPDATYLGKPISEDNIISSTGMFQIRSASKGRLELVPVQQRNAGGQIFESGSKTIVPGVGNTDTVPAALTPGEFVVNKKATQENKPLLEAINSGQALGFNKGGMIPGVQYFAANMLQRIVQPLRRSPMDVGPITNPQQQRHIERKLATWLGGGMARVNIKELASLGLARRHEERELFRGMPIRSISDGASPRFPPEIHEALYRYAKTKNPDELAGIIGRPIAIGARSFSRSKKIAEEFAEGSGPNDASFVFKIKDEKGIYGIDPYQRVGPVRQSTDFKEGKKSYERKEKEIIPVGDPKRGRPDVVVGRIALDKDGFVVIDAGAKLSRREIATVTKEYDSIVGSRYTPRSQIVEAQREIEKLKSRYLKIKAKGTDASSKEAGDLYAELSRFEIDLMAKGIVPRSSRDKKLWSKVGTTFRSMSDDLTTIFNRARAAGMNLGGMVPGYSIGGRVSSYFKGMNAATKKKIEDIKTVMSMRHGATAKRKWTDPLSDAGLADTRNATAFGPGAYFTDSKYGYSSYAGKNLLFGSTPEALKSARVYRQAINPLALSKTKLISSDDVLAMGLKFDGQSYKQLRSMGYTGILFNESTGVGQISGGGRMLVDITSGSRWYNKPRLVTSETIKNRIAPIQESIRTKRKEISNRRFQNRLKKKAGTEVTLANSGGFISPTLMANQGSVVPGAGNKDTVPAMLTPGEFVINKKATMDNLGLLHAINAGEITGMNKGGQIPGVQYLSNGGEVYKMLDGWYADDGKGNIRGPFRTQMSANLSLRRMGARIGGTSSRPGGGGMGSMMGRGMGISMVGSMGGMGLMSLGQQMQSNAAAQGQTSPTGQMLSNVGMGAMVASPLAFLPMSVLGPILAIGAPIAAVGGGMALLETQTNNAAMAAAEMAAGIGGTIHPLKKMGELLGIATPAQRQAQINLGIGQEEIEKFQQEFGEALSTEQGMMFVDELKRATAPQRFEKLSNYLKYAVAAEMMDVESAKNFARVISSEIGDSFLGARVSSVLSKQDQGSAALLDIALQRDQEAQRQKFMQRLESSEERGTDGSAGGISLEDSAAVITTSSLALQDFSNASALAFEELVSGQISVEEYQKVIDESRKKQGEYTQSLVDAIEKTGKLGSSMQVLKDQFMKMGFDETMFKEVEQNLFNASKEVKIDELAENSFENLGARLKTWTEIPTLDRLNPFDSENWTNLTPGDKAARIQADEMVTNVMPYVSAAIFEGMEPMLAQNIGIELLIKEGGIDQEFENIAKRFGARLALESELVIKRVNEGDLIDLSAGIQQSADRAEIIVENRKEQIESIFDDFIKKGGKPDQFLTWIESIPEEKQFNLTVEFGGLSGREQQDYLADASAFAQAYGQEFQLGLQQSDFYKNLLAEGTTRSLREEISYASGIGVSERVINYAIKESDQDTTADELASRIESLTNSFIKLETLPEELTKTLRINVDSGIDLERFGPFTEELEMGWELIDNLDADVPKELVANSILLDGRGNVRSFDDMAYEIGNLSIAYQSLESLAPTIRKQAIIDIATNLGEGDPNVILDRVLADIPNFYELEGGQQSFILQQYGQAFNETQTAQAGLEENERRIQEIYDERNTARVNGARAWGQIKKEELEQLQQEKIGLQKLTEGHLAYQQARAASIASGAGSTVPQALMGALGISYTSDVFKESAAEIASGWAIMQGLPSEIDLNLVARFMIFGTGNKPLSAEDVAKQGKILRKAFQDLQSKDPKKRKAAQETIALAYAVQVAGGAEGNQLVDEEGNPLTPEQIRDRAFQELREQFPNFDKLDIEVQGAMITSRIDYIVEGAELAAANAELEQAMARALSSGDIVAARAIQGKIDANNARIGKIDEEAASLSDVQYRPPSKPSGGGGEKSISGQLKDELKLLEDTFFGMKRFINSKTGLFKEFIAGPFGPQFIEFLKSQGEKGIKILKGDLDKFKQVYNQYLKIQMQTARNVMQTMPQSFRSQALQIAGASNIENKLLKQGFSVDNIETIMSYFPDPEAIAEAYQKALLTPKKKRTEEQKDILSMFNKKNMEQMLKPAQQLNKVVREDFVDTREEALELENAFKNTLEGKNISPEVIDMLIEMGYTSEDLKNNLDAIVGHAQRLDSVLAQTKFADSMESMNTEIDQANYALDLMGQGIAPDVAAAISQIGLAGQLSNEDIQNFVSTFEELQKIRLAAQGPEKLSLDILQGEERIRQLKYEINLIENINKNEVMSALYTKENVDNHEDLLSVYERQNEAKSREIELRQRALEPIDEEISKLEEQKTKIDEHYSEQLEALDNIQKKESELEQLRKGQLDVAAALSRGDVAGAAQAAIDLRRQFSEQRRQDVRAALEQRRQDEIDNVEDKINEKKEERKVIEEDIKRLQLEQRAIQDQIYNVQTIINAETARLENQYKLGNNQINILKSELSIAEREQKLLADAARDYADQLERANRALNGGGGSGGGGGGGGTGGGGGDSGGGGGGSLPPGIIPQSSTYWDTTAGQRGLKYISNNQRVTGRVQTGPNTWAEYSNGNRTGNVGNYMYGGKVNYKGSREVAPGFMMGGKVNKYAFGSFVPGTGMTDKVPAMLTPGEFVVRKPVAQKFGPMLEKMNSQVFPGMGSSPRRTSFVSQAAPQPSSTSVAPRSYSSPRISTARISSPAAKFANASTDFAQPLSRVASIGNKIMPSPSVRMSAPQSRSFSVPQNKTSPSAMSMSLGSSSSSGRSSGNVSYNNPVEYNYSITVNAQSVSNADDIASTVISKIKRIGDRNIRGVSL